MTERTMVEAITLALARALEEDERVVLLGEDIGQDGGVFRATAGLIDRFGAARVRDTPLAENAIAGVSVGLAAQGFRPVAEIQFTGFIHATIDQIANHAARMRNRTRGRLSCPMVLRAPYGGGVKAPEHHSESVEAMFAHIPGLRVVAPSSPARAYGLLLAAIRDPDPVVFFEPKRLYRVVREEVREDRDVAALDRCRVLRDGRDVTLVAWGATIKEALEAANALASEDVSVEVIDVETLKPLDGATLLNSVKKTGRLVVAHEAPLTGGFGGEIAARVAEGALTSLLAPIRRVTGYDAVMPLPKNEHRYMPSIGRIRDAVREVMEYA